MGRSISVGPWQPLQWLSRPYPVWISLGHVNPKQIMKKPHDSANLTGALGIRAFYMKVIPADAVERLR